MEQLMQKYIKYFYITILTVILVQLVGTVISTVVCGCQCGVIISIILFLVNTVLLIDAIKHNVRQQFTEGKEDARILRFTLALLAIFRMFSCMNGELDWIMITDYIMIIGVIETVLTHRIKSIEHLENLANKISRSSALDQKGE